MKRYKLLKVVCIFLFTLVSILSFSACEKKGEFAFNSNLDAQIEVKYEPEISVKNGSIVSVVLRDDNGEMIELGEGYSFTPTRFGKYHFTIVVNMNNELKEIVKTVTVGDFVAPEIVQVPTQPKMVEVGGYNGFEEDLAKIIVRDNDVASLSYLTKKAVKISGNGMVQENPNGLTEVLLSSVGEYVVKVEVKDVFCNVVYTEYKLNAVDTTAPVLNAFDVRYAWLVDGMVKIPELTAIDISNATVTVVASKDGSSLNIVNGKIAADVYDEIELLYTAKDSYNNSVQKRVLLKVLPYGQLFDANDESLSEHFLADKGIVKMDDGLLFASEQVIDSLIWKSESYNFGSVKNFRAISFTAKNYGYTNVQVFVSAKVGHQLVDVGGFTMHSRQDEVSEREYIVDLTKSGLDDVDGWKLSFTSSDAIALSLSDVHLVSFNDPSVLVEMNSTLTVGETLNYQVTQNENEFYESIVTVKNGGNAIDTFSLGEDYVFATAGEYDLVFSFDLGNKIYTVTKKVTVSDGELAVIVDGEFVGGRVNEVYALPTAQAGTAVLTVSVSGPAGSVALDNGTFIPTQSGSYSVTYAGSGVKTVTYEFYVEDLNEISFETPDSFNFIGCYEGGFTKAIGGNFVANGSTAAKALVKGNSYVGAVWQKPYVLNGEINYATLNVYANMDGVIKVGLIINGTDDVLFSRVVSVKKGYNKVEFLLGNTVANKLTDATIKALFLYNQSNYDNVCYIDSIKFSDKQMVNENELFLSDLGTVYGVETSELTIPNVISCDIKFIESVSAQVTAKGSNKVLISNLTLSERIDLNELGVGEYNVKYLVKVVNGGNYTKTISLVVVENAINGQIDFDVNCYTGVDFELPNPNLSSKIYSDEQLVTANVSKYYRPKNGLAWLDGNGTINSLIAGPLEIKYVIRIDDNVEVFATEIYVHEKGVHGDYETWCDGDNYGYYSNFGDSGIISLSKDWAYDGEYSLKIHANDPWERPLRNSSPGVIARQTNLDSISFGFNADAVVIWVYSEFDFRNVTVQFDNNDDKWVSGLLSIKKGVNKQIVTLDKSISQYKRMRFEVHGNEPFYIDSIRFVQLANIEISDINGKQFDQGAGVYVEKPTFIVSSEFFTEEEISAATARIEYETKDGVQTHVFSEEGVTLMLDAGDYDITYILSVGGIDFTYVYSITVRRFECEFVEPFSLVEINKETELTVVNVLSENATLSASIRHNGGKWRDLQVIDGKVTLNLTEAGGYQIRYTAKQGELIEEEIYDILVRRSNSIADFEINPDGAHVLVGGSVNVKQGNISDVWSKDGKYSYRIKAVGDDFAWVRYMDSFYYSDAGGWQTIGQIDFDQPQNALSMWINADWQMEDFVMEVLTRNANGVAVWYKSIPQTIHAGEHKYVFRFTEEFTFMYSFGCVVGTPKAYSSFYIDAVEVLRVDISADELFDSAISGQTYSIEKPTVTVVGTKIQDIKAYLVTSDNETLLEETNGVYNFAINGTGEMNVKIRFDITDVEGAVFAYEISGNATVRAFECEFIEPTVVVELNTATEYTLANSLTEGVVLSAKLRPVDGEWIDLIVTNGKVDVTLTSVGQYEIKYIANLNGQIEEETYKLLVRTPYSIADFELNPNGTHVIGDGRGMVSLDQGEISTEWTKDGKYSYRIFGSGDGFAYVRYMDSFLYSDAGGWKIEGQVDFDAPKNAISMWINADWQMENFSMQVLTKKSTWQNAKWLISKPQTIYTGEHKYVFVFEEDFEFANAIGCYTGTTERWKNFYIDAVEVLSINVETEITDAAVGEEIFFNVPEVTAVGATIKSVKVFIIESEQENELSVSNGKYSFIVQGEQDLILRIKAIDNDGAVICWDYAVSVLEKEDDGFAEDLDWQQFLSQT